MLHSCINPEPGLALFLAYVVLFSKAVILNLFELAAH